MVECALSLAMLGGGTGSSGALRHWMQQHGLAGAGWEGAAAFCKP